MAKLQLMLKVIQLCAEILRCAEAAIALVRLIIELIKANRR